MLRKNRSSISLSSLIILFCLTSLTGQPNPQESPGVIPIDDKSEPGSPLQISGSVGITDHVIANEVISGRSEDIKALNISKKPILLVVAHLVIAGARSSGEDADLVVDNYFKKDALMPDQQISLLHSPPGEHYTVEPYRTVLSPQQRTPQAQVQVLFVQFTDGTTFGDASAGRKWLDRRYLLLSTLRKLNSIANDNGQSAFVHSLVQATASSPLLNDIDQIRRTAGISAAIAHLNRVLHFASQHNEEFRNTTN